MHAAAASARSARVCPSGATCQQPDDVRCVSRGTPTRHAPSTLPTAGPGGRRAATRAGSSVAPAHAIPGSSPGLGRDETPEQALERRRRESKRYEERVTFVQNEQQWDKHMQAAGNNLVVLEVQGESVCQMSLEDTVEYHWKEEALLAQQQALRTCTEIKHTFQRIARDCTDATFLTLTVDDEPSAACSALCDRLGIEVLPTLQFWRNGEKLWEHKGALHMDADLAEGVLFYEGSMADGVQAKDYVKELTSREELEAFVSHGDDKVLKVVNMALTTASPCIHVYPAVLALAKNFVGFASFARVLGDQNPETVKMLGEHNVIEVPTFIFFRGGREVGRHVGSSRADLIGKILQLQQTLGLAPPPKQAAGAVPRRKIERRV